MKALSYILYIFLILLPSLAVFLFSSISRNRDELFSDELIHPVISSASLRDGTWICSYNDFAGSPYWFRDRPAIRLRKAGSDEFCDIFIRSKLKIIFGMEYSYLVEANVE